MSTHPLPEAEERPHKGEGHRHQEPQRQQGQERREVHRGAGVLGGQHDIQHEEDHEHQPKNGGIKNYYYPRKIIIFYVRIN